MSEMDRTYRAVSAEADLMYGFVLRYRDYIHQARDYGNGDPIKMVEVHTLTMIELEPGITVSELAQRWDRTKGTVSVNVVALEEKGYIYRVKDPDNARVVHLYPTEAGKALSCLHKQYDIRDVAETRQRLLERCTPEELAAFYKVAHAYDQILLEDLAQE